MNSSRREQNSGVDLISSTRAFASSLALAPSKGDGPAFFAFQKLSSPLLGLGLSLERYMHVRYMYTFRGYIVNVVY